MTINLRYDHPQSAVSNGGAHYKLNVEGRHWLVTTGRIIGGTFRVVGSGRTWTRKGALIAAKESAWRDAVSNGLTKFRGECSD